MAEGNQALRGGSRRPRLSDTDTANRMLAAGRAQIEREGLSLSLEHVRMEDLIRDAGVSRTSSYRRWPTKDLFAADLLLHIAENTRLSADFAPYADAVRSVPASLVDDLDTEQGRRDLVVEVYRALTQADLLASLESGTWRTYLVLRAAHVGLPDGELRSRVAASLRATEDGFNAYRAGVLRMAATFMGYRLRDPGSCGWTDVAATTSATFTGVLVRGLADPDAVLATTPRAPFGTTRTAEWSAGALAAASAFFAATEPDPGVVWDAARVAEARAFVSDPDAVLAALWSAGTDPVP